MGGSTETTSKVVVPDQVQDIYDIELKLLEQGTPDATNQVLGALKGGTSDEYQKFVKNLYGGYEREAGRAEDIINRQTPRGGAQTQAIAEVARDIALQRATNETDLLQQFLNIYYGMLTGFNPQQTLGRTQGTNEPFLLGISAGPINASIPIG